MEVQVAEEGERRAKIRTKDKFQKNAKKSYGDSRWLAFHTSKPLGNPYKKRRVNDVVQLASTNQ